MFLTFKEGSFLKFWVVILYCQLYSSTVISSWGFLGRGFGGGVVVVFAMIDGKTLTLPPYTHKGQSPLLTTGEAPLQTNANPLISQFL